MENGDLIKIVMNMMNTKESMTMIKRMDLVHTNGQMDHNMKDILKMI